MAGRGLPWGPRLLLYCAELLWIMLVFVDTMVVVPNMDARDFFCLGKLLKPAKSKFIFMTFFLMHLCLLGFHFEIF